MPHRPYLTEHKGLQITAVTSDAMRTDAMYGPVMIQNLYGTDAIRRSLTCMELMPCLETCMKLQFLDLLFICLET
jgi:hypothetical protein